MGAIHPAAALFAEDARKAVAEGPLFNTPRSSWYTDDQGRDILAALLYAAGLTVGEIAGPYYCARTLGLDPDVRPLPRAVRALVELDARNAYGEYRSRANLRRDLLGEVGR